MNIQQNIMIKFNPILIHKGIPKSEHHDFRKWLRYYFDFCKKYHFPESKQESIPHFIKKLQEKHQSANQQKQAAFAISLYHSMIRSDPEENLIDIDSENSREKAQPSRTQKQTASPVPIISKKSVAFENAKGWMEAIHGLSALIKIKHYSPKTLWAYTNWVKKFQGFIRNKDIQSLSPVDVKDRLTGVRLTGVTP